MVLMVLAQALWLGLLATGMTPCISKGNLIQVYAGAILMASANWLCVSLPLERPVVLREFRNGSYGVLAYFLARVTLCCIVALIAALTSMAVFLRPTADEMESRERAGQVALGHVFTIIMLELPRVMCWFPGGFASRCFRCHTNITTDHDAVHGLRAAPEPDAALCETLEVSQFIALVEQDFLTLNFPPYQ